MTFKGTHRSAYQQMLIWHQDTRALRTEEAVYKNVIVGLGLKIMWQSCLKNTMLTFKK